MNHGTDQGMDQDVDTCTPGINGSFHLRLSRLSKLEFIESLKHRSASTLLAASTSDLFAAS